MSARCMSNRVLQGIIYWWTIYEIPILNSVSCFLRTSKEIEHCKLLFEILTLFNTESQQAISYRCLLGQNGQVCVNAVKNGPISANAGESFSLLVPILGEFDLISFFCITFFPDRGRLLVETHPLGFKDLLPYFDDPGCRDLTGTIRCFLAGMLLNLPIHMEAYYSALV